MIVVTHETGFAREVADTRRVHGRRPHRRVRHRRPGVRRTRPGTHRRTSSPRSSDRRPRFTARHRQPTATIPRTSRRDGVTREQNPRSRGAALAAVVLALGLAASVCGSDDDGGTADAATDTVADAAAASDDSTAPAETVTENSAAPVAVATEAFDTTPEQESRIRATRSTASPRPCPTMEGERHAQGRDRHVRRPAADLVRQRRDDPDRQRDRPRLPGRRRARAGGRDRADVVGEPLPVRRERRSTTPVRQHHRHRGAQGEVRLRLLPVDSLAFEATAGSDSGERAGRTSPVARSPSAPARTRSRSCSAGTREQGGRPGAGRHPLLPERQPTSCSPSSRAVSSSTSARTVRLLPPRARPARPRSSACSPAAATSPGEIAATTLEGQRLRGPIAAALNHLIDNGAYGEVLAKWGLDVEAIDVSEVNPPGLPASDLIQDARPVCSSCKSSGRRAGRPPDGRHAVPDVARPNVLIRRHRCTPPSTDRSRR